MTETVRTVLSAVGLRVVRIESRGDRSPPGYWYDQDEHEWVMVVSGEADLEVEGRGPVHLGPGDSLLLPARTRHRVESTAADVPTVWLAVFFDGAPAPTLDASTVGRIVGHMNEDHADALLDYARVLRGLEEAREARMSEVDSTGFTVEAETPAGARQLRFRFEPPVADAVGAREALVAMARDARRRRGD